MRFVITRSRPVSVSNRTRALLAAGCAVFLVLLGQQSGFARLNSRPATVTLIATLESLSISRSSSLIAVGPFEEARSSPADPVSITSSWAVPRNFTTVRVVAYTLPAVDHRSLIDSEAASPVGGLIIVAQAL